MKKITSLFIACVMLLSISLQASSKSVSLTDEAADAVASISDLLASSAGTYVVSTELVVMYVNNGDVYVSDNTGAIKFTESGTKVESGDTLKNAQFTVTQNMFGKKMSCDSYTRFAGVQDYVAQEYTTLSENDVNKLVVLKNIVISDIGGGAYSFDFNGKTFEVYDNYIDMSTLEDGTYDLKGIYIFKMRNHKFDLVSFTKVATAPTDLDHATQLTVSYENGVIVNPNAEIVSIFTALGTRVLQTTSSIDMNELPRGVYIIVTSKGSFKVNN